MSGAPDSWPGQPAASPVGTDAWPGQAVSRPSAAPASQQDPGLFDGAGEAALKLPGNIGTGFVEMLGRGLAGLGGGGNDERPSALDVSQGVPLNGHGPMETGADEAAAVRQQQFTPDPAKTGIASSVGFDIARMLLPALVPGGAIPGLVAPAVTSRDDLVTAGVDPTTANVIGGGEAAVNVASMGLGRLMSSGADSLPARLLERTVKGAAVQVPFGAATREAEHAYLENRGYDAQAASVQPLDPKALATDAVLGPLFANIGAHPVAREATAAAGAGVADEAPTARASRGADNGVQPEADQATFEAAQNAQRAADYQQRRAAAAAPTPEADDATKAAVAAQLRKEKITPRDEAYPAEFARRLAEAASVEAPAAPPIREEAPAPTQAPQTSLIEPTATPEPHTPTVDEQAAAYAARTAEPPATPATDVVERAAVADPGVVRRTVNGKTTYVRTTDETTPKTRRVLELRWNADTGAFEETGRKIRANNSEISQIKRPDPNATPTPDPLAAARAPEVTPAGIPLVDDATLAAARASDIKNDVRALDPGTAEPGPILDGAAARVHDNPGVDAPPSPAGGGESAKADLLHRVRLANIEDGLTKLHDDIQSGVDPATVEAKITLLRDALTAARAERAPDVSPNADVSRETRLTPEAKPAVAAPSPRPEDVPLEQPPTGKIYQPNDGELRAYAGAKRDSFPALPRLRGDEKPPAHVPLGHTDYVGLDRAGRHEGRPTLFRNKAHAEEYARHLEQPLAAEGRVARIEPHPSGEGLALRAVEAPTEAPRRAGPIVKTSEPKNLWPDDFHQTFKEEIDPETAGYLEDVDFMYSPEEILADPTGKLALKAARALMSHEDSAAGHSVTVLALIGEARKARSANGAPRNMRNVTPKLEAPAEDPVAKQLREQHAELKAEIASLRNSIETDGGNPNKDPKVEEMTQKLQDMQAALDDLTPKVRDTRDPRAPGGGTSMLGAKRISDALAGNKTQKQRAENMATDILHTQGKPARPKDIADDMTTGGMHSYAIDTHGNLYTLPEGGHSEWADFFTEKTQSGKKPDVGALLNATDTIEITTAMGNSVGVRMPENLGDKARTKLQSVMRVLRDARSAFLEVYPADGGAPARYRDPREIQLALNKPDIRPADVKAPAAEPTPELPKTVPEPAGEPSTMSMDEFGETLNGEHGPRAYFTPKQGRGVKVYPDAAGEPRAIRILRVAKSTDENAATVQSHLAKLAADGWTKTEGQHVVQWERPDDGGASSLDTNHAFGFLNPAVLKRLFADPAGKAWKNYLMSNAARDPERVAFWRDLDEWFKAPPVKLKTRTVLNRIGISHGFANFHDAMVVSDVGSLRGLARRYKDDGVNFDAEAAAAAGDPSLQGKPILVWLADQIGSDPGAGRELPRAFENEGAQDYKRFSRRIDNAIRTMEETDKGQRPANRDQSLAELVKGVPPKGTVTNAMRDAAIKIRKAYDDEWTASKAAGLPLGLKKDYLNRVPDEDAVVKDPNGFIKAATDYYTKEEGMDPAAAKDRATAWFRNIAMPASRRIGARDGPGSPNPMRSRTLLAAADKYMSPYYVNDIRKLGVSYGKRMAFARAYARHFGAKGEKLQAAYDALDRMVPREQDRDIIRWHMNNALGEHGENTRGKLPQTINGVASWIQTAGMITYLGRTFALQMVEPMNIAIRENKGLVTGFKRLGDSARYFFHKTASERELAQLSDLIGLTGGAAKEMMMDARMNGLTTNLTRRIAHNAMDSYGITGLTEGQRKYAMSVGYRTLRHVLDDVATNAPNANSAAELLGEYGIKRADAPALLSWIKSLDSLPKDDRLDAIAYGEHEKARAFRGALHDFAIKSIMEPTAAETPGGAKHPLWRFAYSLTSFQHAFTREVLLRTARHTMRSYSDKNLSAADRVTLVSSLGSFIAMGIAQSVVQMVRSGVFSSQASNEQTTLEKWMTGLSRVGLYGQYDTLVNALSSNLRYERDPSGLASGPFIGQTLGNLFKVIGGLPGIPGNSPNTNNAEWQAAKNAYGQIIAPSAAGLLAQIPAPPALAIPRALVSAEMTSSDASRNFATSLFGQRTNAPNRGGGGSTFGESSDSGDTSSAETFNGN